MVCTCGCGREVKPGARWAARGCNLRALSDEQRVAASRAWAKAHPEQCRINGRKGGWKQGRKHMGDLLDRWAEIARTKGPSYALVKAYQRGYHAGYLARMRAEKRTAA